MNVKVVNVKMPRIGKLIRKLGLDKDGDVQKELTKIISNRIEAYMPASQAEVLSTKHKFIRSPTEIEVTGPYAHYQYEGEVWGPNIPQIENGIIVGWWSPPKKRKYPTGRKLEYDKTKHKKAGPLWDERLMEAEEEKIEADLQRFIDRRAGK